MLVLTTLASLIVARNMSRLAENQREAARAERWAAHLEADQARDVAKQGATRALRQAAGLLLDPGDRGRPQRRAGPRLPFVRRGCSKPSPAATPRQPLERTIRANLSAWAETVPALEQIFSSGPRFDQAAYTPDGEVIAMAIATDEIQLFRTDTGQPVGRPLKVPFGAGAAMRFAPDGRSLWVASPGWEKAVDRWALHRLDPASGRLMQPPIPSIGPVNRLLIAPGGRYLVGAVLGLHPEDRGPQGDASRDAALGERRRSWCGRRRVGGPSGKWT